jgi:hypothetical protein
MSHLWSRKCSVFVKIDFSENKGQMSRFLLKNHLYSFCKSSKIGYNVTEKIVMGGHSTRSKSCCVLYIVTGPAVQIKFNGT